MHEHQHGAQHVCAPPAGQKFAFGPSQQHFATEADKGQSRYIFQIPQKLKS